VVVIGRFGFGFGFGRKRYGIRSGKSEGVKNVAEIVESFACARRKVPAFFGGTGTFGIVEPDKRML
jgi:hypothetical protein